MNLGQKIINQLESDDFKEILENDCVYEIDDDEIDDLAGMENVIESLKISIRSGKDPITALNITINEIEEEYDGFENTLKELKNFRNQLLNSKEIKEETFSLADDEIINDKIINKGKDSDKIIKKLTEMLTPIANSDFRNSSGILFMQLLETNQKQAIDNEKFKNDCNIIRTGFFTDMDDIANSGDNVIGVINKDDYFLINVGQDPTENGVKENTTFYKDRGYILSSQELNKLINYSERLPSLGINEIKMKSSQEMKLNREGIMTIPDDMNYLFTKLDGNNNKKLNAIFRTMQRKDSNFDKANDFVNHNPKIAEPSIDFSKLEK